MTDMTIYEAAESALIKGDISKMSEQERTSYYMNVCKSLGLNPLTRPFDYITLNGKLTLYARKDATDQLRKSNKVSISKLEREVINGLYVVTAHAELQDGRTDSSIGAVNIEGLKGDALANAFMKCETKAKRRVTLSICGLGMLDESETETLPSSYTVSEPERPKLTNGNNGNGGHKPKWGQEQLDALASWSGKKPVDIEAVLNKSKVLTPELDSKAGDWLSLYINERQEGATAESAIRSADEWLTSELEISGQTGQII
jgi:hypothetical protein